MSMHAPHTFSETSAAVLAAYPAFSRLSRPWLDLLCRTTTMRTFDQGSHVWRAGDRVEHLFLVQSGAIEVVQLNRAGDPAILGLFGPGDLLCFSAPLQRKPYPADAIAFGAPAVLLQLALAPIVEALPSSAELSAAINEALLAHHAVLRAKVNIVSAGSVPRRLAALMQYLVKRFGTEDSPLEATIGIAITRAQIGQFIGARVETVIRILGRWQKAGWLQTSSPHLRILRRDMLDRIIAH